MISLWFFSSLSALMVINTFGILLPAITDDLSLSPTEQGVLGSAPHWGTIALAVPLGLVASRFSPKWLTTWTLVGGTLCLFLQSWAPVFAVLLLGRFLFGIGYTAQQPARALLTRQWFRAREVIVVNGISNVFFGLVVGGGLALAPVVLSVLGDDWRLTIRVLGFYFVALTALWMVLGKERVTEEFRNQEPQRVTATLREVLRHRDLWICGIGFAGATTSLGALLAFYPTFMLEEHNVSLNLSGGILAVNVIVGGVAGLAVGYAATSSGKEGRFLQALGLLMVLTNFGLVLTGWVPAAFILGFLNGFAWAFFPILITVPFNLSGIRPRELAVAFSITMMMVSLGYALGPLITGIIQDATGDLKLALLIMSVASVTLIIAGKTLTFGRPIAGTAAPEPVPAD